MHLPFFYGGARGGVGGRGHVAILELQCCYWYFSTSTEGKHTKTFSFVLGGDKPANEIGYLRF